MPVRLLERSCFLGECCLFCGWVVRFGSFEGVGDAADVTCGCYSALCWHWPGCLWGELCARLSHLRPVSNSVSGMPGGIRLVLRLHGA